MRKHHIKSTTISRSERKYRSDALSIPTSYEETGMNPGEYAKLGVFPTGKEIPPNSYACKALGNQINPSLILDKGEKKDAGSIHPRSKTLHSTTPFPVSTIRFHNRDTKQQKIVKRKIFWEPSCEKTERGRRRFPGASKHFSHPAPQSSARVR